jgi:hypothetical protein
MAPWDENYSSQLETMLAPYRQQAQQMSSPYETMGKQGWLQTHHPRIAGMLDNAFLTAAMTPEGAPTEGVGGGISRTFQGLMGAQQQRRRSAIEDAMLPYQMLQPRLQAEGELAHMGQEGAAAQAHRAQATYYGIEGDWRKAETQKLHNPAPTGRILEDDKTGLPWHEYSNPETGQPYLWNPVTQQKAHDLPAEQQPTFKGMARKQAMGGGLEAGIIDMQMSADPAIQAEGYRRAGMYTTLEAAKAGGRTGAEQEAPHAQVVSQDLISSARGTIPSGLEKPPSDIMTYYSKNFSKFKSLEDAQAGMEAEQNKYQSTLDQRRQWVDSYMSSGAHKQGKPYAAWINELRDSGIQIPKEVMPLQKEQDPNRVATKPTGFGLPNKSQANPNWKP